MRLPSIFPLLGLAQVLGYYLSPFQGFEMADREWLLYERSSLRRCLKRKIASALAIRRDAELGPAGRGCYKMLLGEHGVRAC